jgi:membrane protease YdiL (CAAX protease family)
MRAIVVGLIWAIRHIPTYKVMGTLLWEDGFTSPIICTFVSYLCAMSIMYTWLFEKDNSIWPVTIIHATNNFIGQVVLPLFTTGSLPIPTSTAVISQIFMAIAYFVVAMGVIWFDKARGRRLSDS